jgi:predicted nuclease of restriction endonuclease-like (RecB) superfamily
MKQFYETYKDGQILSTLLRELSWSNNLLVMGRAKTEEERIFYIKEYTAKLPDKKLLQNKLRELNSLTDGSYPAILSP